jgi:cation:H+ antiporter
MIPGGSAVQVAIIALTVLGLWIGARALVDSTVRIARRFGISELTIGLTIVAMGTSTPELVVTVDAALAGLGEIGVGNVVGSNAYNLAFILGAVSLLRVIPVERSLVHRDGAALVLSTLVGVAVLFDRTVSAVEGALLIGLLAAYTIYLVRDERTAHSIETEYEDSRVTGAVPGALSGRARDALLLAGGVGFASPEESA